MGPNDVMEYCKVVEGYTFKSVSSQTVEVSADGVATPAKVTFTYTENPTTATVQVHYRNSIGDDLPGSPERIPFSLKTCRPAISSAAARSPRPSP